MKSFSAIYCDFHVKLSKLPFVSPIHEETFGNVERNSKDYADMKDEVR
jgi:hypothetical protein